MSNATVDFIDRLSIAMAKGTANAGEVAAAVDGTLGADKSTVSVSTPVAAHIDLIPVPSGAAVWSAIVALPPGSLSVAELEAAYGPLHTLPKTGPGAPTRARLAHPGQPITLIAETTEAGAVTALTVQADLAEV